MISKFVIVLVVIAKINAILIGNRDVFSNSAPLNWVQAYETCRAKGYHLLTATSAEDNQLLLDYLVSLGYSGSWLGGTDVGQEGTWVWINSGVSVSPTFWIAGEPNNFNNNEHCLFLSNMKGDNNACWNDLACSKVMPFLCEAPVTDDILTGRRVFKHTTAMNWFQASETCRSNGHQLLTIKSTADNDNVFNYISGSPLDVFWIAATDLGLEGTFVWSTTGTKVTSTFWQLLQPDNKDQKEHCVGMRGLTSAARSWADFDCSTKYKFICEEVSSQC